jgi:hypothetical protein
MGKEPVAGFIKCGTGTDFNTSFRAAVLQVKLLKTLSEMAAYSRETSGF